MSIVCLSGAVEIVLPNMEGLILFPAESYCRLNKLYLRLVQPRTYSSISGGCMKTRAGALELGMWQEARTHRKT